MNDVADLTAHLFQLRIEAFLLERQAELDRLIGSELAEVFEALDASAEANRLDAVEAERILTPLNDVLAEAMSRVLESSQPGLRPLAATYPPLGPAADAALASGPFLMRSLQMADRFLADWLKRDSPSPWMRSLIDAAVVGFADGWSRQREAVRQTIHRAANTFSNIALWSLAAEQLPQHWAAPAEWRYTATLERACPICLPDHGKTNPNRRGLPQPPRHPNCACLILPVVT